MVLVVLHGYKHTYIVIWTCGAMDNASDYGSEDSRFESWQGRFFDDKIKYNSNEQKSGQCGDRTRDLGVISTTL